MNCRGPKTGAIPIDRAFGNAADPLQRREQFIGDVLLFAFVVVYRPKMPPD